MSVKLLNLLKDEFAGRVLETTSEHRDECAVIETGAWFDVARFLRDDPRCDMQMMVDLCGVDYPTREPRFEVVMHLHSLTLKHRLRLKARVGDQDGDGAEIASITPLWAGANWFERETFDLMGIVFIGHPDLRRILTYPEFQGHPLRKNYNADKVQPLLPFREGYEKLPPFNNFEGMSFGRQVFRSGKVD
jgi:NADH-quinone oxidoreductase subunit C